MFCALVLAALLGQFPRVTGTLPRYVAGNGACLGTGHTMNDLDSLRAMYQRSGSIVPEVALEANVRGMEGLPLTVTIPTLEQATAWWITKRTIGGWSCPSNYAGVNLVLSVPWPGRAPLPDMWFDIAGRPLPRGAKPAMPGMYLHRRPDGTVGKDAVTR